MAKTLIHWLDVAETADLMKEIGILPRSKEKIDKNYDRRAQAFAKHALPAQVVRLKAESPMGSLHIFSEIYDNGFLRADPWRWWFAWIALELIAKTGPDPTGSHIKTFLKDSETHPLTDESAARWLACNPLRVRYWNRGIERDFVLAQTHHASTTANAAVKAERHLALALKKPIEVLKDALLEEAAEVSGALTMRIDERVRRNLKSQPATRT
ncbi:MAG: hypothetical protein EXQ95_03865 [Alphaproteobacteria bacterium]|nr:hypothetical protein [Alphaproteobacteria bacterium]